MLMKICVKNLIFILFLFSEDFLNNFIGLLILPISQFRSALIYDIIPVYYVMYRIFNLTPSRNTVVFLSYSNLKKISLVCRFVIGVIDDFGGSSFLGHRACDVAMLHVL